MMKNVVLVIACMPNLIPGCLDLFSKELDVILSVSVELESSVTPFQAYSVRRFQGFQYMH